MLHIYRQTSGLKRVVPQVLAFKRENQSSFPIDRLELLQRSRFRWIRRQWNRTNKSMPQASRSETSSLRGSLRKHRCAAFHIYLGNNGIFWLPFLRRTTLPVVISFHGADAQAAQSTAHTRETLKEVLKRANRVLARSASLAAILRSAGCSAEKLWIHRTGIPLNYFPFRQRPVPERGTWKLLQASRLIPKKGLESSIRAFALFRERWPDAQLRIAGQGPLLDSLKSLTESLGIKPYVEFTGFLTQAQLRDLYYDSHFFLHPSVKTPSGDQEGIPNSLLEAMATGLPCIATRHGGITEAIENEISGLLVSEFETDELAGAMQTLADNPQLYQLIATNGSLVINKQFDLAAQINQLEEIYLETINNSEVL